MNLTSFANRLTHNYDMYRWNKVTEQEAYHRIARDFSQVAREVRGQALRLMEGTRNAIRAMQTDRDEPELQLAFETLCGIAGS